MGPAVVIPGRSPLRTLETAIRTAARKGIVQTRARACGVFCRRTADGGWAGGDWLLALWRRPPTWTKGTGLAVRTWCHIFDLGCCSTDVRVPSSRTLTLVSPREELRIYLLLTVDILLRLAHNQPRATPFHGAEFQASLGVACRCA